MPTVYARRNYKVIDVRSAKSAVRTWLTDQGLVGYTLGLPEVDDRYHLWRVPVLREADKERAGEVALDARTADIDQRRSASLTVMRALLEAEPSAAAGKTAPARQPKGAYQKSATQRTVIHGDSRSALATLPDGSVDLVCTSPPYYNARPEYADYSSYDEYLEQVREVIRESGRVLGEGRFMVMNVSAVLVRREGRSCASRRIAVPLDLHRLFTQEGFEFVDHILWEKPAGAGWATSRGRRFAADRTPLAYKAVPVTEDVLVYRRKTTKLIDWNIRTYPDRDAVARSKIADGYEQTNIWRITPARDKRHPAIYPEALAERVIRYYSFATDTVLDPYAGLGTTGRVAQRLGRGFVIVERDATYHADLVADIENGRWGGLLDTPVEFRCTRTGCESSACQGGGTDKLF